MHDANLLFWKNFSEKYDQYIDNKLIYEFGSYAVAEVHPEGVIRHYLVKGREHIGIDWREGPNVDVVSLAHEVSFDREADVVISASMFEHDPYWKDSVANMVDLLKEGGLMALSWGAALNGEHEVEMSPDHKFWPLPAKRMVDRLSELGMTVVEFFYETRLGGSKGEVCLIAFKGDKPDWVDFDIEDFELEDIA